VTLTWYTPEGERIKIADVTARRREVVRFELQDRLVRNLGGVPPRIGLLRIPEVEPFEVQQGTYELHIDTIVFEEDSDIEARFISMGQVHGIAGTDHRRESSRWRYCGVPRLHFRLVCWLRWGQPSPPCSLLRWVSGLAA
jgi:hypothetical protein